MARKEEPKIQPNNDLEKKIIEAFEVFDHSGKQVVDVREIGTILRSLGCCPTEAEIQEVILATENKEATGNVPLSNFLPYMCKVMIEHRFYPASAEMLLAAFRYFDKEERGYLTKERFAQLMLEEGEPFTQEEYDEMMQTALDPVTDTITYEYYINQLMAEVDCSGLCYRCGQPGHKSRDCSAAPDCPLCAAANKPADHKLGSKTCYPKKKKDGKVTATRTLASQPLPLTEAMETTEASNK